MPDRPLEGSRRRARPRAWPEAHALTAGRRADSSSGRDDGRLTPRFLCSRGQTYHRSYYQ